MTTPERGDPAFYEAFGRAVATLRTARRMSRGDLADEADISYSYVAAIESGSKTPSEAVRRRIAAAFDMSEGDLARHVTDLLTGEHHTFLDRRSLSDAGFDAPVASAPAPDPAATLSAPRRASAFRTARTPAMRSTLPVAGVMAELGPLLDRLSTDDRRLVLDLARRLAASTSPSGPDRRRKPDLVDTLGALYHQFWRRYLDRLDTLGLDWASDRSPVTTSWFSLPSPLPGTTIINRFARRGQLRHELHIDGRSPDRNRHIVATLERHRHTIEGLYGAELEFDDGRGSRRTVRVAEYRPGRISDQAEHESYIEWFIAAGQRMRRLHAGLDDGIVAEILG